MTRILGGLLAAVTLLPIAAQADEARSATVDGVKISAVVSDPSQGAALRSEDLLSAARTAPPASSLYHPPETPAEAGRLQLPTR